MPMPTSLAPGYFRQTYSGVLFPHHMTVPINYDGTPVPGVEPSLKLKDATTVPGSAAVGNFIDELLPFFPSTTHFGLCEFHTVDAVTGDDQFIWGFNVGLVGVDGSPRIPMSQVVVTFKLATGGLYRVYLMEGSDTPNNKVLPPFGATPAGDLSDFLTGDTSPVYGRSNSYPFAPVSYVSKINDKLRKQQGLA